MTIPLSKPYITTSIYENLHAVLRSGKLSGGGGFGHKVEVKIAQKLSSRHVLLTTSCTHALEMAVRLLQAKAGDEIILPSFTFTSTANAVLLAGLRPVFCDVDPRTMNMDPNHVAQCISSKTIAIMPVHYAGVACHMEPLLSLCADHNLVMIEDAAQAMGSLWRGKPLGTFGQMGALSFHDTKNVMCGEGGAFLTQDDALCDHALIFREKGTNRNNFLKGLVDKYTWVGEGSSYVLAEPLAAILDSQVDIMDDINLKRQKIHNFYCQELYPLEQKEVLSLPFIPEEASSNYHLFYLMLSTEEKRNSLMAYLKTKGIVSAFHYVPLHLSPVGQKLGYGNVVLPTTENQAARLLRIPLFPDLSIQEQAFIVQEIFSWHKGNF